MPRPLRSVRRDVVAAVLVVLVIREPAPACFAGENVRMMEHSIKAGLLYNFLKYTEWPANHERRTESTATVCIFGDDPFHGALAPMADRTVNQRRITLQQVHRIEDTAACDLLFVNADEKASWPQLSAFLADKSVLTVSDFRDFAAAGGMVEFGEKADRIDVRVNMKALGAARLVVQDRLLTLARVVSVEQP